MKKQTDTFKRLRAVMKDVNGDHRQIIKTMQDQIDYLMEFIEIQGEILEEKTGHRQPELSDDQKKRLAHRGKKLNQFLLGQVAQCFAPKTIHDWYRELIAEKYDSSGENQKKRGRKPVSTDLQELVLRLAEQNPHWGYKRIRDYAEYLGYEVSFMTVKRILNKHGIYPADNDRPNSNWDLFFNTHQDVITACDFATYELVTPHGLQREHILFFENIATREVWLGGIAHDPDGNWMAQIGRNQCDMWSGQLLGQKYLIHDRDPLFCQRFKTMLSSIGCQSKPIPPRSPECNGYMESFIKTFKTECLNHLILSTESQLRYVINEFLEYYNHERPHSALGGKMIAPHPQDADGEIMEFSRLGGLLKSYRRVKIAA